MCVGSIVTIECNNCGSSFDNSSYLGCATYEHSREGWETRTDSIISRPTYSIPICDECSDFDCSFDSDNFSLRSLDSVSSVDSMAEYDTEVSAPFASYYSLGRSSALTVVWSERAVDSLENFTGAMGALIDRIIALSPTPATEKLKLNIFLIYSECDAYLNWTETENDRAITTEAKLSEILNDTGVTDKINAVNVEDMTADMIELFENLTSFHPHYDVQYNAGRFEGYLAVLTSGLEELEADAVVAAADTDVAATDAAAEAFSGLARD
ncbi:unnamed protein product [Aureobasidium vineae]|uniref:Uncharacterized protein n=1 Tax=Aureobasidium vineae TaxID=2773715 RepID=A0A9N8JUR2_9PEZI|nr:unnamed protein product [Aureobasidium vineae]